MNTAVWRPTVSPSQVMFTRTSHFAPATTFEGEEGGGDGVCVSHGVQSARWASVAPPSTPPRSRPPHLCNTPTHARVPQTTTYKRTWLQPSEEMRGSSMHSSMLRRVVALTASLARKAFSTASSTSAGTASAVCQPPARAPSFT